MILGIDLGKKTTGLAISHGTLATSYKTITHKSKQEALDQIVKIATTESIDIIVLGYVEGKIKSYFTDFANHIRRNLPKLEIVMVDETLTSRQAQQNLIKLQIPKGKRAKKEHEVAAALILQSYIDSQQ